MKTKITIRIICKRVKTPHTETDHQLPKQKNVGTINDKKLAIKLASSLIKLYKL